MQLPDTRFVITGGTRGIGRALALALTAAGARVLAVGARAGSVRRFTEETGLEAICCDITEPEDVQALAQAVASRFGALDGLVHCAGIQRELDLMRDVDMADVEQEIAVNLTGPIRVTHALRDALLAAPAPAIVNVTSVLALTPKRRAPVYCATKAAFASWTVSLRDQLGDRVRVMELVPPLVDTDMAGNRRDGALAPEEVARACVRGLVDDRDVVRVGKARFAKALSRIAPGLLARKLRDS